MIIGIGCDAIEVARVTKALRRVGFAERVFTLAEREYCMKKNGTARAQSFAVRFAAKEAALKSLGTGLRCGRLQDIEIANDAWGKPSLRFTGRLGEVARRRGVKFCHVSLSHLRETALAYVVLEGEEK